MFIEFDKLGRIKDPSIVLCNPNGHELESIDATIINTHFDLRFNSMSEMTFTVPSRVNSEPVKWYNLIVSKRVIKVENIGAFMIHTVIKTGDGLQETKEVTAFSLEVDLNYKKINLLSGIYKFYDAINPNNTNTLLGKLMSIPTMKGWKIGYVSPSLWNKVRSYEISDQTIYNFLMTTVEETMECVVVYDTFNKTINFYDTQEAVTDTDIYLSYDNLVRELSVEEMSDELVTALHCYGGGELDIRAVNPLGDVIIYNFDYFIAKNEEWLTSDLRAKIEAWQNLQKSIQVQFADLLTQFRNKNSELIVLQGELVDEQSKYANIEGQLKVTFEAGDSTVEYAVQLEQQQIAINNKQSQITAKENELKTIQNNISEINSRVKLTNNFTEEEITELSNYIVESTYTNNAFIKNSTMSAVEIQDMAQELYDLSNSVLDKLSKPRFSFTMQGVNFLFLQEFLPFSQQLRLGCSLSVDMDNDLIAYPVLLELSFGLDDPTDFEMTFANRLRLDKTDYRFSELFGESINVGNTVTIQQGNWNEFNKNYQTNIDNFMKNEFDAGAKNIVNTKNQEIKIGAFGILGQKLLENGSYSPKKFGLINNQLVFTKDNFRTISGMFGETTSGAYGLLADILVGKLLLGSELRLEGRNATGKEVIFSFDSENGVFMKNASIIMSSGENLENYVTNVVGSIDLSKYDNILTKDGLIDVTKMQGHIQAGNNNILLGTGINRMVANENGILITKNDGQSWDTAISAYGIVADAIQAGGTISGCIIKGGSLNIGEGTFTSDELGNVKITKGSININDGAFSVDNVGNVAITKGSIDLGTGAFTVGVDGSVAITKGSLNLGEGAFTVDRFGDVVISKGSINIGEGKFEVNSNGDVKATSMTLTGAKVTDSIITGGSININNGKFIVDSSGSVTMTGSLSTTGSITLGGNINITGAVKWSASSSPVKAYYSVNGSTDWHENPTSSDKFVKYSYDGGVTWTQVIKFVGENGINGTDGKDGTDANLPEFITQTYIDGSKVESPVLRGGLIEGATLRCIGTEKSAIEVRNSSGVLAGYIKYDDKGNGNNEGVNRMFICTEGEYNMKLQSAKNMSLSGEKIYLDGTVVINGTVFTGKVTPVFS